MGNNLLDKEISYLEAIATSTNPSMILINKTAKKIYKLGFEEGKKESELEYKKRNVKINKVVFEGDVKAGYGEGRYCGD